MMTRFSSAVAVLACMAVMSGCAYEGQAGNGNSVRAIMASQIVPPKPHAETGSDAAAATAAYANYLQSYVQPTPQTDSSLIKK